MTHRTETPKVALVEPIWNLLLYIPPYSVGLGAIEDEIV